MARFNADWLGRSILKFVRRWTVLIGAAQPQLHAAESPLADQRCVRLLVRALRANPLQPLPYMVTDVDEAGDYLRSPG